MSTEQEIVAALDRRWRRRFPHLSRIDADLLDRYAEPWRVYHDVRHLDAVLARCDELATQATDIACVELAAWFHDAVYDIGAADNEERSAVLATDVLHGRVAPGSVEEVARLVRLTARHDPAEGDANGAVLCDADLAVLGSESARYDDYARQIRREYHTVPDAAFRSGRAAILRDLLGRDRIFHTEHGRARWEAPARANLARELGRLITPA